jgi:hypothetical protein
LLSTAVVAVDMEVAAAAAGTAADLAAVVIAADSAVAMQLASQADTLWWVAPAATPVVTAADRTTLLALDTRQDFAVATLAGASHPSMHTAADA